MTAGAAAFGYGAYTAGRDLYRSGQNFYNRVNSVYDFSRSTAEREQQFFRNTLLDIAGEHATYLEYNINPVSVDDKRARMSNQLLMRGHGTVDEALQASFGEWPPKGLQIIGENDQRIRFTDFGPSVIQPDPAKTPLENWVRQKFTGPTGQSYLGGERVIEIDRFKLLTFPGYFGTSGLTDTQAHELIHVIQGDHSYRAVNTFGLPGSQFLNNGKPTVKSDTIADNLFAAHTDPDFGNPADPAAKKYLAYLQEGSEIQARMHEIMINGYQRWGTMPQNKEHLLVAMENSGFVFPSEIKSDLEKSSTIIETRKIFSPGEPVNSSAGSQIAHALSSLTDHGKIAFWNETMPELYANYIEMIGDGPGRERFDLGINEHRALREYREEAKAAVRDAPWQAVTDHDGSAARKLEVTHLSDKDFDLLCNGLHVRGIDSEFRKQPNHHGADLIVKGDEIVKLDALRSAVTGTAEPRPQPHQQQQRQASRMPEKVVQQERWLTEQSAAIIGKAKTVSAATDVAAPVPSSAAKAHQASALPEKPKPELLVKSGEPALPARHGSELHAGRTAIAVGMTTNLLVIGVSVAAGAQDAAKEAGRDITFGDYAHAAWDKSFAGPLATGRYLEGAVRAVSLVDPSIGVGSSLLRQGLRGLGADVDAGMTEQIAVLSGDDKRTLARNARQLGVITRNQTAFLQDAGLFDVKDDNGKRIDIPAILRDPDQRDVFMGRLEKNTAAMTDPAEKEKGRKMLDAAKVFVDDEARRIALTQQNNQIMTAAAPNNGNQQALADYDAESRKPKPTKVSTTIPQQSPQP